MTILRRLGLFVLLAGGLSIGTGLGPAATLAAGTGDAWQAAPVALVQAITNLPQSLFDAVAIQPTVVDPVLIKGQPPLKIDGKPGIFYQGAEPCPYCAAERWAFIIALSRFGHWTGLGVTESATHDIDPATQSFTFLRARYSSPYVAVATREVLSNKTLPGGGYAKLQQDTAQQAALFSKYTTAQYFPANPGYFPFLDFDNRVVMSQSSFDPAVLHGLSRQQIVTDLADPTNQVTLDIVAAANYLTAATCLIDGDQPKAVCQSPGVRRSSHFAKKSFGFGPSSCTAKNGQSACGGAPS